MAFPAHLAVVLSLIQHNHGACSSPTLASPAVVQQTQHVTGLLSMLRFGTLDLLLPATLSSGAQCRTLLAYFQLTLTGCAHPGASLR